MEKNALGNTLKDHIMSLGIVDKALEYITVSVDAIFSTRVDDSRLKLVYCFFFLETRAINEIDILANR